jgi:DNA repair protein RadD
MELRPHQTKALDLLRASLMAGKHAPLLQAPTGYGKTVVAAHITRALADNGKRAVFVVPALSLVDQTFDRFRQYGIDAADMGVIQSDHPWRRPSAPVQIATAQTLARRTLPECDYAIIDEAHVQHAVIRAWIATQRDLRASEGVGTRFVGLTATPWSKGLGTVYDDLLRPTSLSELIDQGYCSPFRVFAPASPDLTGVRTRAGDFHEGDLAAAMDKDALTADIVSTWLSRGEGRPTLCFAVNRAHAKSIHDRFLSAGVPCAYVDANTPRQEREAIGRLLQSGEIKIVVNIGCLTTGVDWDVRCLVLARPTKSKSLFVQIIGRGLRTADGKDYCLILDHSDTHYRLGMVTEINQDELCDGTPKSAKAEKGREKSLPKPVACGSCAALIPVMADACPCCGTARPKPSYVEAEGDLTEIGAGRGAKSKGVRAIIADLGKQRVYSEVLGIAEERCRSRGWAAHAYREVFGVWPSRLVEEPIEPSPLIRSWCRSRDIAFAKSHKAKEVRHAA